MTPTYIYGLVSPLDDKIFYVGYTVNLSNRLSRHKYAKSNARLVKQIEKISKKGLLHNLRMEVLEVVPCESKTLPTDIETFWIQEIGKTNKLSNYVKEHWGLYSGASMSRAVKALREFRKKNVGTTRERKNTIRRLKMDNLINPKPRDIIDKKAVARWKALSDRI